MYASKGQNKSAVTTSFPFGKTFPEMISSK